MNRHLTSATMIGVVALISATASTATRDTSTRTQDQKAPPAATETGTDLFIKRDTSRAVSGSALLNAFFQDSARTNTVGRQRELDVIIATLPDPLDSHLDYTFDAELAALRQAFEVSGYITDRFWLPWPVDREKNEISARLNHIDTIAYRRSHPGVMLFRHARDSSLRLLYIVGEVPTSGIHVRAMDAALRDRVRAFSDPRVRQRDKVIRLVAPVFTGGAPSLGLALARWRAHTKGTPEPIEVISGSASGTLAGPLVKADSGISYHATIHSDSVLDRVERNVLCKRLKISTSRIALLRESNTQYGALQSDSITTQRRAPANDTTCMGNFLDIPFPANISSVRSQYARAPAAAVAPTTLGTPSPRIALDLEDPVLAIEHPAVMSALTPAIVDVMLDQIARTLSTQHIRAVGIMATDTRDKLFLAEQIRRRMHDLTLFTTESNVLLLQRDLNASLRGMLVFATYPLTLDAQQWDAAGIPATRFAFANDASEGIFNATRLQLDPKARLVEYGPPRMGNAPPYCDYGLIPDSANALRTIPPVWVLVVGRSTFFPITACPTGNSNALMPERLHGGQATELETESAEGGSYLLIFVITIALGLALTAVERRHYHRLRNVAENDDGAMREMDRSLLILQGHLYAGLRILAFGIIIVGTGIGIIHRVGSEGAQPASFYVAIALASAVGIGLLAGHTRGAVRAMLRAWRVLQRQDAPNEDRRSQKQAAGDIVGRIAIAFAATWFVATAASYVYDIVDLGDKSKLRQELLLHRAGELAGGFSPAMILALIGAMFGLWCTWHLQRIGLLLAPPTAFERASLSEYVAPGWPYPQTARWSKSMRMVRTHLLVLVSDVTAFAVFATFLALALVLSKTMFVTYEALVLPSYTQRLGVARLFIDPGTHFDFLVRFGLTTALAATGWAVFRVSRIWMDLQRTLGKLGRTPQVTAFERLPRRIARLTQLNVYRPHAEALVLSISAAQAAHLRHLYSTLTVEERRALAEGQDDARIGREARADTLAYLEKLMSGDPAVSGAWRAKQWRSDKEARANQDASLRALDDRLLASARMRIRGEEADALRFLFDVTERAHAAEPGENDLANILAGKYDASSGAEGAPRSTSGHIRRTFSDNARLWVRAAEELLAVQAVDYIQWVIQHLRQLTVFIVVSLLILTEMLLSYVLQPAGQLWLMLIALVLAAMVVLIGVIVAMNRDEVLSRIAGTTPGTVTWNLGFVLDLSVIVAVPVLTFLGTTIPWLHDGLLSWIDPLLRSVGRH